MDGIRRAFIFASLFVNAFELCLGHGFNQEAYVGHFIPFVSTYSGPIRGKVIAAGGTEVSAFLGIPYAEPPTGEQRFKKAVPKRSWTDVHNAIEKPPPCMQYSGKDFPWVSKTTPSEDCLYLNIWVPGLTNFFALEPMGKAVMLFIHGGGYFCGGSELEAYDGATLAAQGNVIVVSINYRLGSFGFLSAGSSEAPGNMGMLDQHLAIKWIKNNIKQFNGDPDKITLFGESAGAVSVGLHLISPLSRNLFKRAIMQSGSPYHPVASANQSVAMYLSNVFATGVGCADNNVNIFTNYEDVIQCLRKLDAQQLVDAEGVMLQRAPFLFLPIYGDEFMPTNPIAAMDNGDFKHTEVLIGTNKDEGSVFLHDVMPDVFGSQKAQDISVEQAKLLIGGLFQNTSNPDPQVVVDYYLKDASDSDPVATRKAAYDSFGDFVISCPTVFFAEKFAEDGDAFFYFYTQRSSNSPWGDWVGVPHFEEVPFVFGDPVRNKTYYIPEDSLFSKSIMQKWSTFAKYGNPLVSKTSTWPKFTQNRPLYLELNSRNMKVGEGPGGKACEFWRKYFVSGS